MAEVGVFCRDKRGEALIPVQEQPEPANFDQLVRKRGERFLRAVPHPKAAQFKNHEYWRKALPELRASYSDICAYCSCWIPFGRGTLDHFEPKSANPSRAYEWSNFRLAQEKINNSKGESTDVLDPFHIDPGWFQLDFSSMYVKADRASAVQVRRAVNRTINVLQLNSNALQSLRYSIVKEYSDGAITIEFLDRRYPFIAAELRRQGIEDSIKGKLR